jgi:hypothetical protein
MILSASTRGFETVIVLTSAANIEEKIKADRMIVMMPVRLINTHPP